MENFKNFTSFEWFLIWGTLILVAFLITLHEHKQIILGRILDNFWHILGASLNHGNFIPKKLLSLFLFGIFVFFFFQCIINFNGRMSSSKVVRNESCVVDSVDDIIRNRLTPIWFNGSYVLDYFLSLKMPDGCVDDINYPAESRLINKVLCEGIEKNLLPFDMTEGPKRLAEKQDFAFIALTKYFDTISKYLCMIMLKRKKLWISKQVVSSTWRAFIHSTHLTDEKRRFFYFL